MVQINFAQKQVSAKIVYYGPGMSGKTTNLEVIHQRAPEQNKGELTSISTDGDRTLFFDFMPLDLGTVAGMKTSFQIYTVPGQVYYNSTRKLVLQGVDGVVFVADSSAAMMNENLESLRNLEENLNEYGKSLATLAHVIQFNKRDLPDALSVEELSAQLNVHGAPCFEAIANSGQGVFPTLKALASRVLEMIHANSGASRGAPAPAAAQRPHAAPAPQAPLPHSAPRAVPLAVSAPVAAHAHTPPVAPTPNVAATRIQPGPVRGAMPPQGQSAVRLTQPTVAQPAMPSTAGAFTPTAAAPSAPLAATGLHPNYAPPAPAHSALGLGATASPVHAPAPVAGHPQQVAPMEYAASQPAQPAAYAQQAPTQSPNLHLAARGGQTTGQHGAAPKNLRTGPVPAPLEGTRFRPRASGAANAPRMEPRATPARTASSKLFVAVFVVAGAILAAGLAYVAMSFL